MKTNNFSSVDDYLSSFPENIKELLAKVRETIRKAAPEATEAISYNMPAYKINGKPMVFFAGYDNHIGFYATPSGHARFSKQLSGYKQGKGSVQFPLEQEIPLNLIAEIARFRANEILENK